MLNSVFSSSKDAIKKIEVPITIKEREMMAKALLMEISEICLLNTSTLSLPRARLIKLSVARAKVLVLIPPPVELGDAPIHMRIK